MMAAMPIELACDRCDRRYTFGDGQAGVHFRCQVCGKLLRVPVPVLPVDEGIDGAAEEEWEGGGRSPDPRSVPVGLAEVRSVPPPLPPPPVPLLPPPPVPVSQYQDEPDARVSSGDFWRGLIIPLGAVAVFIVATGVYGIYARSRPAPVAVRSAPAPAAPRNTPATPAPNPRPRAYPPPVQPPVDRMYRPSPAPPPISRPPRTGPGVEAGSIPEVDVSKLPVWEPTDAADGLGEVVGVGDYAMRAPKGWTHSGTQGGASQFWVGPRREGMSMSPRLAVTIRPRTDRVRRQVPVVLTVPGQRAPAGTGLVVSAQGGSVEYGLVNGIAVAKVKMLTSSMRRRIQYAAYEGENSIFMDATFDVKDEEGSRLVDAAVRTLARGGG